MFKGAALAYSVYPEPYLRPSSDFDILIRTGDRERAFNVLSHAGYEPAARITGDLIMPQRCMTRRADLVTHTLDVHWKLVNPVLYSERLTFDALWAGAVSVPRLTLPARMPTPADHLLISCLHRIAHHQNADDLLWLYDIHLLARALDEHQRQAAMNVTVRNVITSMRLMSALDWAELFESVSLVDEALRAGGAFTAMDFPTRDAYRHAIEEIARGAGRAELDVAQAAVREAQASGDHDLRRSDPGYYLIGAGRLAFEAAVGFRATPGRRLLRAYRQRLGNHNAAAHSADGDRGKP